MRDAENLAGAAARAVEERRSGARSARRYTLLAMALAVLIGIGAVAALTDSLRTKSVALVEYTMRRGTLPIVVTERGNLESQSDVKIICQVDDVENDGIHGTPIVFIVPNGASVEEGQLLVELDSSSLRERLDRQLLDTERARSDQIQAKVRYENQLTQNKTSRADAQLQVDLAELALKQFEDEDGGTFQIELQDVELLIQEAQASKLIEATNLEGVEQLYKLGYRSSGELAQARLSALKAERQLATAISRKKELVDYKYRKTKLELQGNVESAKRALLQVERDNEAFLEQARAAMEAADEALKKEEERLARYRDQLAKCKLFAPRDGMVAYASGQGRRWSEPIREGAAVRPRQAILSLPNLRRMQVKTSVHESVLDQVRAGLPVTVRVDPFPERLYSGTVKSVAVLPDQDSWLSSDTKVYETVVTIDEDVEQLKPGMTAVVEIHVDRLENVLSVPVQAVVQIGEESWCYVSAGGDVDRRPIELGRSNDKFVEIRSGLEEGDVVVLNPMAIVDEDRRDESTIAPENTGPEPPPRESEEPLADGDAGPGDGPRSTGASAGEDSRARRGAGERPPRARPDASRRDGGERTRRGR